MYWPEIRITSSVFFSPCEIRPELAFGDIVGDYRIVSPMGAGGFGIVYRAVHRYRRCEVALKVTRSDTLALDPLAETRLLREARMLARVSHHGVVGILDVGRSPDGRLFVAMEHVPGRSLNEMMDAQRLGQRDSVMLAVRMANGLSSVHEAGVVHGDVTPRNVLLSGRHIIMQPVWIDFGNSHRVGQSSGMPKGRITGTPYYMSPEQARGSQMDHRSDIYSLGAIIYEMVSGSPVFDGESGREIAEQHVYTPAPILQSDRGPVPERLQRVIARCLEKNPTHRFQSASQLARVLRSFVPRRIEQRDNGAAHSGTTR